MSDQKSESHLRHICKHHRVRSFKRSRDPQFAEKMTDIVGLYLDPPAHTVVLSIDEKSQIQALDRKQPGLPLKPRKPQVAINRYLAEHNAEPRPFVWAASAASILAQLARLPASSECVIALASSLSPAAASAMSARTTHRQGDRARW
jgi:hypothetical protein